MNVIYSNCRANSIVSGTVELENMGMVIFVLTFAFESNVCSDFSTNNAIFNCNFFLSENYSLNWDNFYLRN